MPSSNYGPLIDQNTPPNVQLYYKGENPDFVFEAPDPNNKIARIRAGTQLVMSMISIGILAYILYANPMLLQIDWQSLWTDNFKPANEDDWVGIILVLIFGGFFFLSFLNKIIKNIIQLFVIKKLWYIGTTDALKVTDQKDEESISWDHLRPDIEYVSNSSGDKLVIKLQPGYLPDLLVRGSKHIMQNFNTIEIINPPNIMEVKRLIEKRIRENASGQKTDDKELQELIDLEKDRNLGQSNY